jgi:hypothetical protein
LRTARAASPLLAAAAALLLGACIGPFSNTFRVSGDITLSPRLSHRTIPANTTLFIVATNSASIPVAVKKIIDPKLPLHYRMDSEDLVLPGENWKGPLTIKVYINSHGKIGQPASGDLGGSYRSPVFPPESFVSIVIDEVS